MIFHKFNCELNAYKVKFSGGKNINFGYIRKIKQCIDDILIMSSIVNKMLIELNILLERI